MPTEQKDTGGSKGGRPTGAKTSKVGGQVFEEDIHPELQSNNWMKLKSMVYDDEKINDNVNEIDSQINAAAVLYRSADSRSVVRSSSLSIIFSSRKSIIVIIFKGTLQFLIKSTHYLFVFMKSIYHHRRRFI